MKIAIGCDEIALDMKNELKVFMESLGHSVDDFGVYESAPVLYPDVAIKVAEQVKEGNYEKGVLICGTGIGMAITANKVPGVRAAVCHDPYSTQRARMSNDAQIATFGSKVIGLENAKFLLRVFLESDFQGGRSVPKVEKIKEYEKKYFK